METLFQGSHRRVTRATDREHSFRSPASNKRAGRCIGLNDQLHAFETVDERLAIATQL